MIIILMKTYKNMGTYLTLQTLFENMLKLNQNKPIR